MSKLTRENAVVPLTAGMDLTGYTGCPVFIDNDGNAVVILEPSARPYGVLVTEGKEGEQVTVAMWGCGGTVKARIAVGSPLPAGHTIVIGSTFADSIAFTHEPDNAMALFERIAARLVAPADSSGLHEVVLMNPQWVDV